MKKASWIVLTIGGIALTLLSLVSAAHAYLPNDNYAIGPLGVSKVAAGNPEVESALRGIRGTSAAYGAGFGVLTLAIVLGPYRRGEVWAWKALCGALVVQLLIVLLRVPLLGATLGTSAAILQISVLGFGLLLDAGRLRGPK
jgi:hypothetical protein